VLHLRRRLQVLGHRVRGGAHHGAARHPGDGGHRPVPAPRPTHPLPMSEPAAGPPTRLLRSAAAWLLGLAWVLPLAYAVWRAFHPREYSARFVLSAPLTLANFAEAWHAAPFARYFVNTVLLVALILVAQLVLCTLAAYAFARFDFAGRTAAFVLVLAQLMIMP